MSVHPVTAAAIQSDCADLLAMLRRMHVGMFAIATMNGDIGPKARAAALELAECAAILIKRVEKQ